MATIASWTSKEELSEPDAVKWLVKREGQVSWLLATGCSGDRLMELAVKYAGRHDHYMAGCCAQAAAVLLSGTADLGNAEVAGSARPEE